MSRPVVALHLPDATDRLQANRPQMKFSLPGEWIDRRGQPRPRIAVRRIVVLKADHIGDLLIAARAFSLLRYFFPAASIDLICGRWNVDLARRLEIFDNVYGVDLFHETSGLQSDAAVADATRREGVAHLQRLSLGGYDVAIDLRYDRDSRSILQALDASVYAGFGQRSEFPFLDIAIPIQEGNGDKSAGTDAILPGAKFHRDPGSGSVPCRAADAGRFLCERSAIDFTIRATGAMSPADCGTSTQDVRRLGVGLEGIRVTPIKDGREFDDGWRAFHCKPGAPELALLSGWSSPEAWGAWGVGEHCSLRLDLPQPRGETHVRVDLSMVAHVNQANPEISCAIHACTDGEPAAAARFAAPEHRQTISVLVPRCETRLRLISEPFRLAPGKYEGSLRLYLPRKVTAGQSLAVTLRSRQSGVALLRQEAGAPAIQAGLCEVRLACWVELGNEELCLEVETHDGPALEAARVELLTLRGIESLKTEMPPTHMETRACLLVLQLALEFSDQHPFGADDLASRLTLPPSAPASDPAGEIVSRLSLWKDDGLCLVGLGMGCSSEIRKWPPHYFVELAKELAAIERVRLVFVGSPSDRDEAVHACEALGLDPCLHVLCGSVALADLGRLLGELDLFVSNNTGTIHFAGRVGVRSIGIYAGTNHPREFGPVGTNTSWLMRDEPCAPCFLSELKDCRYGHRCLRDMLPSEVLAFVVPEIAAVLSRRDLGDDPTPRPRRVQERQ